MDIKSLLKQKGKFLCEEYHLCCYDPAMWLEEKTVLDILNLIKGDMHLVEYWSQKPEGNGPWSWPIELLLPKQVEALKRRFWKIRKVEVYQIHNINLTNLLKEKSFSFNFIKSENKLFIYYPSNENYQNYYIDELKAVAEFYEVIEAYFGKFIILDVDDNTIFVPSTEGAYGSYSLAYDQLGKKGCRNYFCLFKCPVFPLDEHLKTLTYKIQLEVNSLTSEVTDIIIYDIDNRVLASLNQEGEFAET